MDRSVIDHRLESLRRCITRIESRRPSTVEELQVDADLQDILSVNLERAVQLCVDIANHLIAATDARQQTSMGEAFDILYMAGLLTDAPAQRIQISDGDRQLHVQTTL